MKDYIIGVDLGTTQTKAVLFQKDGKALQSVYQAYPLMQDVEGKAEEDPDLIAEAVFYCISEVVKKAAIQPEKIACVSFASAMHSLIVMNENNQRLTNCLTWADNRSSNVCEKFKQTELAQTLFKQTGTPYHPMTTFMKLLWLKESAPELLQPNYHFVGIKEYVLYQLFGEYVVDICNAAGTGFYNVHSLEWEPVALAFLGITSEQLPRVAEPDECVGKLSPVWAEKLNLSTETKFILGGADGGLSNIGLGAIGAGQATVTVGTSGAFRYITEKPIIHPQQTTFCYALDGRHWLVGGASNNGGIAFEWGRKRFLQVQQQVAIKANENPYDCVMDLIAENPLDQEPLLFFPYLLGERAPIWQAEASAAFVGLKNTHTEAQMMRAILEGICFNLKQIVEEVQNVGGGVTEIRATGGFAKSAVWKQMMADVLGYPLSFPESTEASCFGAVIYAWKYLGSIQEIEEAQNFVKIHEVIQPRAKEKEHYQALYGIYLEIQKSLQQSYALLANFKS